MSSVCLPAGDTFVPIKIEENNLYDGILKLLAVLRPGWPSDNIKFKVRVTRQGYLLCRAILDSID